MPICEICGIEVKKVEECDECDSKFCEECGDINKKLCYDCIGWTEDINEDWIDEELN
jgi:hypothetical protein